MTLGQTITEKRDLMEKRKCMMRASDLRRIAMLHNKELGEILSCLQEIEGTADLRKRCERNMTFLNAISLIPDKGFVIAVTGLQGVGKSTLANAILNISGFEHALPEGRTRCEKVPVLVRTLLEGELHQAHALPSSFLGNTKDILVPVTMKKARNIAQGELLEDGREAILVDYPLPNEATAVLPGLVYFLILPGYEKMAAWSDLAIASMLLADHAIFVVDDSSLATQTGKQLLTEAMERFGGNALTVVVTKMDQFGPGRERAQEKLQTSLNTLGIGSFSGEAGNLFFTAVPDDNPVTWTEIDNLRSALFDGSQPGSILAHTSRVRQLALNLKRFAEDDLEDLVRLVDGHLEKQQTVLLPNHKIYFSLLDKVASAKEKAVNEARIAVEREVNTAFEGLPEQIGKKIYKEASPSAAFFEKFNPWQDYDDQQEVKLNRMVKEIYNEKLLGIPVRSAQKALEAFRNNLPESIFIGKSDEDDKEWYECVRFQQKVDIPKYQDDVTREFLAAAKPIATIMIEILERASMAGHTLDKKALSSIAIEVMNNVGVRNIRRGLVALGLVESVEIGMKVEQAIAAPTIAAAGGAIATPLAVATGLVLAGIVTALSLRSAKSYKVNASREAKYLVASSEESVQIKILASIDPILDWFQEGLDRCIRQQLGLTRAVNVNYRLAIQRERVSVLRGATLKVLSTM